MSDCFKPPTYNNRAKNLHWINSTYGIHDLICHCENPAKHLLLAISEREELIEITKAQKHKITKCLFTTDEEETTTGTENHGIDEVALDAAFADDFTEEG